MIEYSLHARQKMEVRRVTEAQVEAALAVGRRNPSFKGRQVVAAQMAGFEVTVVIFEEEDRTVVITAWRSPPWEK